MAKLNAQIPGGTPQMDIPEGLDPIEALSRAEVSSAPQAYIGGSPTGDMFRKKAIERALPVIHPYLLCAHPNRITVAFADHKSVGVVVPEFGAIRLIPGLSRIDEKGNNIQAAIQARQEQGWKVIPLEIQGQGNPYIKAVDSSTRTYLASWQSFVPGIPDPVSDMKKYIEFCKFLYDSGFLERPHPQIIEAKKSALLSVLGQYGAHENNMAIKADMNKMARFLQAYDNFLGKV